MSMQASARRDYASHAIQLCHAKAPRQCRILASKPSPNCTMIRGGHTSVPSIHDGLIDCNNHSFDDENARRRSDHQLVPTLGRVLFLLHPATPPVRRDSPHTTATLFSL